MLAITLADLRMRFRQFPIAVVGAGLVFAIALLLSGMVSGFHNEIDRTVASAHADGWVLPSGTTGPFASVRGLPRSTVGDLASDPGVDDASGMVISLQSVLMDNPEPSRIMMIGADVGQARPDHAGRGRSRPGLGHDDDRRYAGRVDQSGRRTACPVPGGGHRDHDRGSGRAGIPARRPRPDDGRAGRGRQPRPDGGCGPLGQQLEIPDVGSGGGHRGSSHLCLRPPAGSRLRRPQGRRRVLDVALPRTRDPGRPGEPRRRCAGDRGVRLHAPALQGPGRGARLGVPADAGHRRRSRRTLLAGRAETGRQGGSRAGVRGELVVLLGPSGCGKTTLLSCLAGLLTPKEGSITLGGTVLIGMGPKELAEYRRRHVGVVFQAFNLIPSLTALGNVVAPMSLAGVGRSEARSRATELLTQVGLADRMHHRPSAMSGGQQQRVAIARALVHDPQLALADEPTAHLDHIQVDGVLRLIRDLAQPGRIVVVATHDDRITFIADRAVELVPSGSVAEREPEDVVLADGEVLFRQGSPGGYCAASGATTRRARWRSRGVASRTQVRV